MPAAGDLAAGVALHLGQSVRVVDVWRRLAKVVVEFEVAAEEGNGRGRRRCIGKVYRDDRGAADFDVLARLREAGLRPPSAFTVVRPIAYLADHRLLLQEKAPGRPVAEHLFRDPARAADTVAHAAGWVAALQAVAIDARPRLEQFRVAVARYRRELTELLPHEAPRLERLTTRALAGLEPSRLTPLVLSHGDFHPKNVFIADGGRVTAIDLDTFGRQERAADVAYFLAQTAIRGYFHRGNFAATAWARQCFLRAYLNVALPLDRERVALYLGMSLLQSLHYELCVLHTQKAAIVEPWLIQAERCLLDDEPTLPGDPVPSG